MKSKLEEKIETAQEVEVDPDRHQMEEAILATVAAVGPDDPFAGEYSRAYFDEGLTFDRDDLEAIGRALRELVCIEGKPADLILLKDKLSSIDVKVEGAVLEGILDGSKAKDPEVAREYIKKIHALNKYHAAEAVGREYQKAIERGKKEGEDPEVAFSILADKVLKLGKDKKLVREHEPEAVAAYGFIDELDKRRTDGRAFLGLDCGFNHLNEVLNGLGTGVYILAGAPSCGKTTLAKQIADHVAEKEKVPVLFYSFEQSAEELRIKSLARLSFVDSRVIWKGRTGSDKWEKVKEADKKYREGPGPYLTIIEAGPKDTIDAIRAAALMAKRKSEITDKPPLLLVIDYLQIIPAGKEAPDAIREKIDWNLSELRRLSRDLKAPILVVSSMNRASYQGNNPPTMASLKESGGIEYSADGVICLWRDKEESESLTKDLSKQTDRIVAFILKNRNGELSKVKLNFTKAWALFSDEGKESLDYDAALGNA